MYYLYLLTNNINGKTYIGQTKNPERRWSINGGRYKNCPLLFNAFQKYGFDNFEKEILFEVNTKEEINELEIKIITEYKKQGKAEYNIAGGGYNSPFEYMEESKKEERREKISKAHKGKILSEEHKQKLSISHKGHIHSDEQKRKISEAIKGEKHPLYGKKHSEETKKKIGEASSKRKNPHSEETKKKIGEANKNNPLICKRIICIETQEIFNSITEATEIMGFKSTHSIMRCLNRPDFTAKKYHWEYI